MPEENEEKPKEPIVVNLQSILSGKTSLATAGLTTRREDARRRQERNPVSRLKITSEDADNWSKLTIIFLMVATVLIALVVSSYKYLNLGLLCRPDIQINKSTAGNTKNAGTAIPATGYVNCHFDSEQQKDAGALVQSIVSGIVGIVAGMGIGSRKQ
jgi:hypothetical protein